MLPATTVPSVLVERGADVDGDVVAAGVLHAPQVEDLGAAGGELEHLLVGDGVELAGGRDDPRVGGEDAVDVGVDLADLGLEGGGQRDRGRVGAAAAEGGDLLGVLADALEPGHDHDVALLERGGDPARGDVDDLGLAVHRVGDHAGLGAGERAGGEAEVGDRHRHERHRDALTGGEQHVELAGRRERARPGRRGRGARRCCRPWPRRRRRRRDRRASSPRSARRRA